MAAHPKPFNIIEMNLEGVLKLKSGARIYKVSMVEGDFLVYTHRYRGGIGISNVIVNHYAMQVGFRSTITEMVPETSRVYMKIVALFEKGGLIA